MKNKKCITCSEHKRCKDSYTSWIFFIIGLIATLSIRAVTILAHVNPLYGKIAWYVGVSGFFLFFIYKFKVNRARAKLISKNNLVDKINAQTQLGKEDYNLISTVLCSISSKKEVINYFFICMLSGIAIILAIYLDFLK